MEDQSNYESETTTEQPEELLNESLEAADEAGEDESFTPEVSAVARQTMIGDLRDVVLNILRDPRYTGKEWKEMKEQEQKDVTSMVTLQVEEAIVRAIDIIHSDGQRHIKAILKQVTVKDGYKGVFECSADNELRHELADSQGDTILVCLTNTDAYLGERESVKFDKDQPELPVSEAPSEDEETTETEEDTHDGQESQSSNLEREADGYI